MTQNREAIKKDILQKLWDTQMDGKSNDKKCLLCEKYVPEVENEYVSFICNECSEGMDNLKKA